MKRKDEHALHSPFLFDFYRHTVQKREAISFPDIEALRSELYRDTRVLLPSQMGAGSMQGNQGKRISEIARTSLSPKKQNRFFAQVIQYLGCRTVLELGTSLGINAAYLAKSNPSGKVVTIEGNPEIGSIAQATFDKLKLSNVELIMGTLEEKLHQTVQKTGPLDFVFFDGNHREEATWRYVTTCLPHVHGNTLFVFHDIYWSKEMEQVWKRIISLPEVTASVDMFHFGLVFFRPQLQKQHMVWKF